MTNRRISHFFLLLFLLLSTPALAQDISVKKDIIYKDGEPYAQMKKSGGMAGTYTISALDGTEVMVAVFDKVAQDYAISFSQGGEETHIPNTIGFGKVLAKDIVRAGLFKNGQFNPAGKKKFLAAHPSGGGASQSLDGDDVVAVDPAVKGDELVQRSRTAPIMIMGQRIMQDNKNIGNFTVNSKAENGTVYHTYRFSLPDGTIVAEAVLEGVNAKSARVVTMKDNRKSTISVEGYDQAGTAKKIAAYLSERYYM